MNKRVDYLYRDGSNYKRFGVVVFEGTGTAALQARLMSALESGEFFIADQVRLPELFFPDAIDADDHCFHEMGEISEVDESPDDLFKRTFEDLVFEVEGAARDGWRAFDPLERARLLRLP